MKYYLNKVNFRKTDTGHALKTVIPLEVALKYSSRKDSQFCWSAQPFIVNACFRTTQLHLLPRLTLNLIPFQTLYTPSCQGTKGTRPVQ
jgi:hypothetical protein